MSSLKELVKDKIIPRKIKISKAFQVRGKDIKVEIGASPLGNRAVWVNFIVLNQRPLSQLTSTRELLGMGVDPYDCEVFGTRVVGCSNPKLPQCADCPLAHTD